MKKILLVAVIALCSATFVKAQKFPVTPPEKGDYVCLQSEDSAGYNFIFQKSKKVYYNYNVITKKSGSKYKSTELRIKELYDLIDKIDFSKIKSADFSKLGSLAEGENYRYIEYKKETTVYKIVWNSDAKDKDSKALNQVVTMMNSFW